MKWAAALCLCSVALAAETSGVWLDVPFVAQERDACGAASIAMVLQYWSNQGYATDAAPGPAAAIQRELYSEKGHGIYASALERYFQEHGFRTFAFRGSWDDLKQHLKKGRPLIAALKPWGRGADLHYVVVSGLDWEHRLVLLNDPAQRKLLKEEWPVFEKEWSATGKWILLAVPQKA